MPAEETEDPEERLKGLGVREAPREPPLLLEMLSASEPEER